MTPRKHLPGGSASGTVGCTDPSSSGQASDVWHHASRVPLGPRRSQGLPPSLSLFVCMSYLLPRTPALIEEERQNSPATFLLLDLMKLQAASCPNLESPQRHVTLWAKRGQVLSGVLGGYLVESQWSLSGYLGPPSEEELEAAARERPFPAPMSDNEHHRGKRCPCSLSRRPLWGDRPISQKRKLRAERLISPRSQQLGSPGTGT